MSATNQSTTKTTSKPLPISGRLEREANNLGRTVRNNSDLMADIKAHNAAQRRVG